MPGVGDSPSFLKFVTIALYAMVLMGLVVSVVRAGVHYSKTGETGPLVEATVGQVVFWDYQIYEGLEQLKDANFINSLPESFRADFKNFVARQIFFYVMLFAIMTYLLFKLGNWLLGIHAFSWQTDVIVVAVIILVIFPFAEYTYGALMFDDYKVIPYRGLGQFVKPSTWELLFGDWDTSMPSDVYGDYQIAGMNTTSLVVELNSSSGGGG